MLILACFINVVVIDLPSAYGMLLSRKWSTSLGGSIQMDLTYALIPNDESQLVILYSNPYYLEHVEDLDQSELVDVIGYVDECECEESTLESQVHSLDDDEEDVFVDASEEHIPWEDKGKEKQHEEGSSSNPFDSMDELYDLLFYQGNLILIGDILVPLNKDFQVTSQYH